MGMEHGLDKFTVFNTLPYDRKEVITGSIITRMKQFALRNEDGQDVPFEILHQEIVDAGLIDRQIVHYGNYDPFVRYDIALYDTVPAMGYRTYFVQATEQPPALLSVDTTPSDCLENGFYRIEIAENGSLTVTDKVQGTTYEQVLLIEDGSDDGDGYDYSPLEDDLVLTSASVKATSRITHHALLSRTDISFRMNIPSNLEARRQKWYDGYMDIRLHVTLRQHSPLIELSVEVDNQADDHRVRLLIPNQMAAQCSVSDNQFGSIVRPARDSAMDNWEKEKWSERPDAIYPFLSYVAQDTAQGLSVLTNSVREFELVGEGFQTIAITLFRSVGVLGKEDLYRRPGRPSGIRMDTPDSQMRGVQIYDLALTADRTAVCQRAKEYITPLVTYNKMPYNAMKLNAPLVQTPYQFSLFSLDNPLVTLSVVKKEEEGDDLLVRCYNATDLAQTAVLHTDLHFTGESALDESICAGTPDSPAVCFAPNQTRTLRLTR